MREEVRQATLAATAPTTTPLVPQGVPRGAAADGVETESMPRGMGGHVIGGMLIEELDDSQLD